MIQTGNVIMSFALIVIVIAAIIISLKWPFRAAIFPIVVGIPVLIMAMAELLRNLIGKKRDSKKGASFDHDTKNMHSELLTREDIFTLCWVAGFFLLIFFLGFTIAIPILVFLYLKFHGNEPWGITIIFTVLSWLLFLVLFVKLLEIPFTEGWLIKMLKMI